MAIVGRVMLSMTIMCSVMLK